LLISAKALAVAPTKSMTGHLLVLPVRLRLFLVCCRFAIKWHRHRNLDQPGDRLMLNFVPHHAQPMKIDAVLSNSFGFGGTNGSLLLRRYSVKVQAWD